VTIDKRSTKAINSNSENRSKWLNLSASLNEKYKPSSSIESATLAVVKIETILGLGSGFFVSDDGYIVTNKHVIRPQESSSWEKGENSLKEEGTDFKEKFSILKDKKERLNLMKEDLRSFKHQLDNPNRYDNPISQKGYDYHERRYTKGYKSYRKSYKRTDYDYAQFKQRKKIVKALTLQLQEILRLYLKMALKLEPS
jgi:hypothetical protein